MATKKPRDLRSERIQLRATPQTRSTIERWAERDDLSIADVVAKLVREELKREERRG